MKLRDLINDKFIVFVKDSPSDINEALFLCAKELLKQNKITKHYIEDLQKAHKKLGPYYVVAPDLAIPHTDCKRGVKDLALQLTIFRQGMDFHSKVAPKVYLAFTLVSPDTFSLVAVVENLFELFEKEEDLQKLKSSENIQEVLEILKQY